MSKNDKKYTNMTRGELKDSAKKLLAGNWNKLAVIVLAYVGLSFAAGVVDGIIGTQWIATVTSLLLFPVIVALMAIFMNFVEGKEVGASNLFDFYKDLGFVVKIFFASVLVGIAGFLGLLLFIIPGIIVFLGFSQFMWVMLEDRELGIIDALKKSWELMKGQKLAYFVLNLSFIGWILLTIPTLFIGMLWLIPYMYVTYYLFYKKIKAS